MNTEAPVRILELDAASWTSVVDFYSAVIVAVGGAKDAMTNLDGIMEYLIWGMGNIKPPYIIRICGTGALSQTLIAEIELLKAFVARDQDDQMAVDLQIVS